MGKFEKLDRRSDDGQFRSMHVVARERTLSRSSADYVFARGKGEAAYKLLKIIEGGNKSGSIRKANIRAMSRAKASGQPVRKSA